MRMTKQELEKRETLIERIEAYTGTLLSLPYHMVKTTDLEKLLAALEL